MPPCWWRRRAPARPRGCRWCWRRSRGRRARRSSCSSRGGSRPAPPPRAWRRRSARRWARPSATACASARKCRARPASRSSPKACSPAWCSTIPRSTASRRCCSTNSTSARSTPISASRWRATCSSGLRDDLKILVMSATIDGARVAKLLGDAPVIESEGRAFPVETRYLGRDATRADRAPGGRRGGACAARGAGLGAGVPAGRRGNPPHRDVAARARSTIRRSMSSPCSARSTPTCRTAPSRRRRRAGARSCWPPRSPRPRSPSKACAS